MNSRRLFSILIWISLPFFLWHCTDDKENSKESTGILILYPALENETEPSKASKESAIHIFADYLKKIHLNHIRIQESPASEDLEQLLKEAPEDLVFLFDGDDWEKLPFQGMPSLEGLSESEKRPYDDRFVVFPQQLEGGRLVLALSSKNALTRQYALYEVLRRLGFRFFHPEDEFVPEISEHELQKALLKPTVLGEGPLFEPSFRHRGYSFHAPHPLEHLEAFSDADFPIDEARNVNDWIIKNRGDSMRGLGRGISSAQSRQKRGEELEALRQLKGLRYDTGITLHNQQQGSRPDIDFESDVPPEEQARAYVRRALKNREDVYRFSIHFGPTELTTTPDLETVALINAAGDEALKIKKDIIVEINDHTTGQQAVEHFDDLGCPNLTNPDAKLDYYDLAFVTDKRLTARVHTVMFYPLEGSAPVYHQESFAHKLCLMEKASKEGRPLSFFPETAYWLSWDNAVPVFLPLYLYARYRDIQLLKPLLEENGGSLHSHRTFNSGQEWDYWQADYAIGLLHYNANVSLEGLLSDLADPFCPRSSLLESPDPLASCPAKTRYMAVMLAVMESQKTHFLEEVDSRGIPGGLYLMFAGEDPADDMGAVSGLMFRPVRIPFREVLKMTSEEREHFETQDLSRLKTLASDYHAWLKDLQDKREEVPENALRFWDETMDGLEINALRAAHTASLYEAILAFAKAPEKSLAISQLLEESQAQLASAKRVIAKREAAYRYPMAQMVGGGITRETGLPNGTTYPYRVHTKTHLLSYWHSRQEQVEDILNQKEDKSSLWRALPVFAGPETPVHWSFPEDLNLQGEISLLDGEGATTKLSPSDDEITLEGGIYQIKAELDADGVPFILKGGLVRSKHIALSEGFHLLSPNSALADMVLDALLPSFWFALEDKAHAPLFAVAPIKSAVLGVQNTDLSILKALEDGSPDALFKTQEENLVLPILDPSSEETVSEIRVSKGSFSFDLEAFQKKEAQSITLSGQLLLDDLVDALVFLAGFDEEGAIDTLSGILDFDPSSPPEWIPFEAEFFIENQESSE